jgi:hypothetical protein
VAAELVEALVGLAKGVAPVGVADRGREARGLGEDPTVERAGGDRVKGSS